MKKQTKKKRPDLSIVVPCYNEEKNIPLIVEQFRKAIPADSPVELILVDNGSTDGSNRLIRNLMKKHAFIKLTHIKKNIGYGFGIWTGINAGKGEYLCWTHADMQTDPYDTIRAYKKILKQKNPKKCYIKGKRSRRPFVDTFFTLGMSLFETLLLRTALFDINAQPNLFHRSFLKKLKNPPKDFSFDLYTYYLAKKLRYHVVKFPVQFKKRIHGISHWNTCLGAKWKFIKRTVNFTIKLKKTL